MIPDGCHSDRREVQRRQLRKYVIAKEGNAVARMWAGNNLTNGDEELVVINLLPVTAPGRDGKQETRLGVE